MYVDGASNHNSVGAGVLLISPEGVLHEQAIRLEFSASNNEAEYEALLAGLHEALELGVSDLTAFSDSQLVVGQMTGEYEARDDRMGQYLSKAKELVARFANFSLIQIKRDLNAHADILAGLAAIHGSDKHRTITF